MFERPEFFGSTTVGERGQIVLPVELRKQLGIKAGDKLMVLGVPGHEEGGACRVMLFKAEVLYEVIDQMERHQEAIRKMLAKEVKSKK